MNILIIEDSKIMNNLVKKRLNTLGKYDITQAFSIQEADTLLDEKDFDVIILDLMEKVMN